MPLASTEPFTVYKPLIILSRLYSNNVRYVITKHQLQSLHVLLLTSRKQPRYNLPIFIYVKVVRNILAVLTLTLWLQTHVYNRMLTGTQADLGISPLLINIHCYCNYVDKYNWIVVILNILIISTVVVTSLCVNIQATTVKFTGAFNFP
jgi:hypothetical protein